MADSAGKGGSLDASAADYNRARELYRLAADTPHTDLSGAEWLSSQAKRLVLRAANKGYAQAFIEAGKIEQKAERFDNAKMWYEAVGPASTEPGAPQSLKADAVKATAALAALETLMAAAASAEKAGEQAHDSVVVATQSGPTEVRPVVAEQLRAEQPERVLIPPVRPLQNPTVASAEQPPEQTLAPTEVAPQSGSAEVPPLREGDVDPFHEPDGNTIRLEPFGPSGPAAAVELSSPTGDAEAPATGTPPDPPLPAEPTAQQFENLALSPVIQTAPLDVDTSGGRKQAIADIISRTAGNADDTIKQQIQTFFDNPNIANQTLATFAAGLPLAGEPNSPQAYASKYVRAATTTAKPLAVRDKEIFLATAIQAAQIIPGREATFEAIMQSDIDRSEGQRIARELENGNLRDVRFAVLNNKATTDWTHANYINGTSLTFLARMGDDNQAYYQIQIVEKHAKGAAKGTITYDSMDGQYVQFIITHTQNDAAYKGAMDLLREEGPGAFQRELETRPTIQRVRLNSGRFCDIQTIGEEKSIIWESDKTKKDQRDLHASTVTQSDDGLKLFITPPSRRFSVWKPRTEIVAAPAGVAVGVRQAASSEQTGFTKQDIAKFKTAKKVLDADLRRRWFKPSEAKVVAAFDVLKDFDTRGLLEAQLVLGRALEHVDYPDDAEMYYGRAVAQAGKPGVDGASVQEARVRLARLLVTNGDAVSTVAAHNLMQQTADRNGIRALPDGKTKAERVTNEKESAAATKWADEARQWINEVSSLTKAAAAEYAAESRTQVTAAAAPAKRGLWRAARRILIPAGLTLGPVLAAAGTIAVLDGPDGFQQTSKAIHSVNRHLSADPSKATPVYVAVTNASDMTYRIMAALKAGKAATFMDGRHGEHFILYTDRLSKETYAGVVRMDGTGKTITTDIGAANGDPDFVGNIAALAAESGGLDKGKAGILSQFVDLNEPGAAGLTGQEIFRVRAVLEPERPIRIIGDKLEHQ